MSQLSRREFTALAASAAVAPFTTSPVAAALSVQDVIDRIKKQIGVEWKPETVDGLKAGDPPLAVTGIVTTSIATMGVLQQAVKAGVNFVVTAHPTFYSRGDAKTPPAGRGGGIPAPDAIFTAKDGFVAKHNLAIFRLSDHWRLRQPSPAAQGIAAAMGWTKTSGGDAARVDVAAVPLDTLAADVKKRLNLRGGIRVIGDPQLRVQRIGLLPGSTPLAASLKLLPQVDAIVAGEVREWESVEYVRDQVTEKQQKALILIGRIVSEEPGMGICATWLKTFVPEVPVRHIAAGDPYWRPA